MGLSRPESMVSLQVSMAKKRQVNFNHDVYTSSSDSLLQPQNQQQRRATVRLKMPPSSKPLVVPKGDPRSYIKPQPLPISSQKGLRIQARSDTVYNPALPNRDGVRKENYDRRCFQLKNQGFKSRPDKPYQGLGDPFYLDTKKLILHSLGQWEEGQHLDTSSSSDSEDDNTAAPDDLKKKSATPANFVLRRARKGLNTLPKEITRQRGLIRNVRLGHGLFQQLRKEREDRTNQRHREDMKKRQQQLNEWQPPRYSSSSDEETDEDEDISEEVDLKSYMTSGTNLPGVEIDLAEDQKTELLTQAPSLAGETLADQSKSRVAFQGLEVEDTVGVPSEYARSQYAQSARSRTSRASSRKKLPPARPYTPQHSYIGTEISDYPDSADDMDSDVISVGSQEIGGTKTTVMKQQSEKKNETRWKQFVTNQVLRGVDGLMPNESRRKSKRNSTINFGGGRDSPLQPGVGAKRNSVWRMGNRFRAGGRGSITGRNSVASVASLSDSHAGMEYGSARGLRGATAIPEGSELSHEQETGTDVTEEDDLMGKGPLRYLDEFYEREQSTADAASQQDVMSARSDRSSCMSPANLSAQVRRRTALQEPSSGTTIPRKTASPTALRRSAGGAGANGPPAEPMPTQEEVLKFLESITRSEEDPRFHALANPKEKMSSKDLRADLNVHPRLTPAVLEYQATLPSNRVGKLAQEQRQKFAEVKQEKALMLHDALEAKDRQRLRVLQNKFLHMPTGGCSFHRALSAMRCKSASDEEQRERRRHSSTTHQAWYMDLLNNVPEDMKKEWFFQVILDKLSKYGLVDSTKQSAYKLLKVLTGLRDWEICCPDISAAIEFCRDKICEMTVDDFEEWFKSQFPTVLRPQTAPAANRNGKDKRTTGPDAKPVPRSAPPGLSRTDPSKGT